MKKDYNYTVQIPQIIIFSERNQTQKSIYLNEVQERQN